MKLSAPFRCQQLLFGRIAFAALATAVLIGVNPAIRADTILLNGETAPREGKVLGVSGTSLQFQVAAGTITWPLANVKEVQMPQPPEYAQAFKAFTDRDLPKAQQLAKQVADKYKGLPTDWAKQSIVLLGNIHVAKNEIDKAKAVFQEYERLYPTAAGAPVPVQMAVSKGVIAAAEKDYAAAHEALDSITAGILKEKTVPASQALAYSQAFYTLGKVKEAEGNLNGALEDYLRTVTLFYYDPAAAADAQQRADLLRRDKKIVVP